MKLKAFLYFLFMTCFWAVFPAHSQVYVEDACVQDDPPVFTGIPESTPCDDLGNLPCELVISNENNTSSIIGSSIIGKVVCIQEDFFVDSDFSFIDCTVKIDPGVSIVLNIPSPTQVTPISLQIENSTLFACNDLWKGIILGEGSSIRTTNSTIEDAEAAIYSNAASFLYINSTTFNRNRVGIQLERGSSQPPLPLTFIGNTFSCDAPLNGTANEITFAGVQLKDGLLFSLTSPSATSSDANRFTGLENGIYAEGDLNLIIGRHFEFNDLFAKGVFMEGGFLSLDGSEFVNAGYNSIHMEEVRELRLRNSGIRYNEGLGISDNIDQLAGILLESFSLNSRVSIEGNNIFVDFRNLLSKKIDGIRLIGGNVGSGTSINIQNQNNIRILAPSSKAINVRSRFLSTTAITIADNFIYMDPLGNSAADGIEFQGSNRHNLSIIRNTFKGGIYGNGVTDGIVLTGNGNSNIEVSDNNFPLEFSYPHDLEEYGSAIVLNSFNDALICDNTIANAARGLLAAGMNLATEVSVNTFIGGGTQILISNGFIDQQVHSGNKFTHKDPGAFPSVFAEVRPEINGPNSRFIVHTSQSIETGSSSPPYYSFFSPYYPSRVIPTDAGNFFLPSTGSPLNGCIVQFGQHDNLNHQDIANGAFGQQGEYSLASLWDLTNGFYTKLKEHPEVISIYAGYQTFLDQNENTSTGKLYDIRKQIDSSFISSPQLNQQSLVQQFFIDSLILELEMIDSIIYTAQNESGIALHTKKMLLGAIANSDSTIAEINEEYRNNIHLGLNQAINLNTTFTASNPWENNVKTANHIYLASILFQNGQLTETQYTQLAEIAIQCPISAGAVVYEARALLPPCLDSSYDDQYEGCYPSDESADKSNEERKSNFSKLNYEVQVFPSPTKGLFTVFLLGAEKGKLSIFDSRGVPVLRQFIQNTAEIELSESGVYFCRIEIENQESTIKKVIVTEK